MDATPATTATAGGSGTGSASKSATGGDSNTGLQQTKGARRQVRLRLTPAVATQLAELPHTTRAEVVALLVNAGLNGIDATCLVGQRQELVNLGRLLNQSLRVIRGHAFDVASAYRAVAILNSLTEK